MGKLKKNETYRWEKLGEDTQVSLGKRVPFSFKNVKDSDGLLNKYLGAIELKLTGILQQSAATAALPKEDIHGLMAGITLKCNGHTFFLDMPGNLFVMANEIDGVYKSGNAVGLHAADFANDVLEHALDLRMVIPLCWFQLREGEQRPHEGAIDLALFGEKGELNITMMSSAAITADWGIKAATYLTLSAKIGVLRSPHLYVPRPFVYEMWADGGVNPATSPVLAGKCDQLFSFASDFDALTRPTGEVFISSDNEVIRDELTGAEIVDTLEMGREDEFGRCANTYQPLIVRNVRDTRHCVYGSKFELKNVNTTGSGMSHAIRRLLDCPGELLTKWAAARKLSITKEDVGRFLIDGEPINTGRNARMSIDERAGLQREFL